MSDRPRYSVGIEGLGAADLRLRLVAAREAIAIEIRTQPDPEKRKKAQAGLDEIDAILAEASRTAIRLSDGVLAEVDYVPPGAPEEQRFGQFVHEMLDPEPPPVPAPRPVLPAARKVPPIRPPSGDPYVWEPGSRPALAPRSVVSEAAPPVEVAATAEPAATAARPAYRAPPAFLKPKEKRA